MNEQSKSNTLYTNNLQRNKKKTLTFEDNDEEQFMTTNLGNPSKKVSDEGTQQSKNNLMSESLFKSVLNNGQSDLDLLIPTPNNFNVGLMSPSFVKSKQNQFINSKLNLSNKKQNIISKPSKPIKQKNNIPFSVNSNPFQTFAKIPSVELFKKFKKEDSEKVNSEVPELTTHNNTNIERLNKNVSVNSSND
jgi:hypothetical protein